MEERRLDLSPAKWIWVPSERTIPNTFACFRKEIEVDGDLLSAEGYMLGCSRYLMTVNGRRAAWGPAPADPRYEEADGVDIRHLLNVGKNIIGFRVLYYGYGDGTWVAGRPGLIFKITLRYADGRVADIISDGDTLAKFDGSHPAGMYKRWFLRALQEQYDARLDPAFDLPCGVAPDGFVGAMELPGAADKPSSMNGYPDYLNDTYPENSDGSMIRKRLIPMAEESFLPAKLDDYGSVSWQRDPDDWFRFRMPDSFIISSGAVIIAQDKGKVSFELSGEDAVYLTYMLPEQACGFISFEIDAPEGTVIEAMIQESHDKEKIAWLDSHFYSWTRFICQEGGNHFVSFDTECFMYLQLHIREAAGEICVKNVGILRRTYPVKQYPKLMTDRPKINKLFEVGINTLKNSAIETFTDGMGRERQQYSGDCNHQVKAFSYLYGADDPIVRRFYETYSDGLTNGGYFMDCWPAADRMMRIPAALVGLTIWLPILDHGIQFVLDTWNYFFHTGDRYILDKCYDGFLRQYGFIKTLIDDNGLVGVENLKGVSVWIDHTAFRKQRDKQCALNLSISAMIKNALSPMCRYFGHNAVADEMETFADGLILKATERYYDPVRRAFIDNLPFLEEDGYISTSDRSVALSLIYDFLPEDVQGSVDLLVNKPEIINGSYPCNMVWEYRALAKHRRQDIITADFEQRWYELPSIEMNSTIQEYFYAESDSTSEMSHCAVAPLLAPAEYYMGLECAEIGFKSFKITPVLDGFERMEVSVKTVSGDIGFNYSDGGLTVVFPDGMSGIAVLKTGETVSLISGIEISL